MSKHLHIVCLNVPYPVDYGGVFDLFYKLKYLQSAGISIHLHCFEYGRGEQEELNKYCVEVHYYKRRNWLAGFSLKLPYIVRSRANHKLIERLNEDAWPVLLEGIHCTYYLYKNEFKNRKAFVRLHNVEYEYYRQLARSEHTLLKKSYFLFESFLLRQYEKAICNKAIFLSVSKKDDETYKALGCKEIKYLPVFIPFTKLSSPEGKGDYCLYHGNLSVSENEKVCDWLIKRVFKDIDIQLVIAGKDPSKRLIQLVKDSPNVTIISNPSEENMQKLITLAQVNILPSFNSTGIKIKLLNALFTGRHCLVNTNTIKETGLEKLCHIADDANSFKEMLTDLVEEEFTSFEIEKRRQVLLNMFNNEANASRLINWLY